MQRAVLHRPRIARETRLLLTTALLAVLAMWMLARLRFPAPPAEPRAIPSLLSTLATGTDFDGLASQVARVRALVASHLVTVEWQTDSGAGTSMIARSALRIGGDLAVVQMPPAARLARESAFTLVASDGASGLALVRLPGSEDGIVAAPRIARAPQPPEYLIASAIYPAGVALRPVFLAAAAASDAPLWSSTAWVVPAETGLTPGSLLFSREGEFAGMVILHRGSLAFVSGETVLDEANRLMSRTDARSGDIGIQAQDLTDQLRRVLGSSSGVVVSWVDPNGPARDALATGDVIESIDGQAVASVEHWSRLTASTTPGAPVALIVHRGGMSKTITVTAGSGMAEDRVAGKSNRPTLGARLREVRGAGSSVIGVSPDSFASRAGLAAGDLITSIGSISSPTPDEISEVTGALRQGQSVLLGVRRGPDHQLLVLER